jgi:hypothetical protein
MHAVLRWGENMGLLAAVMEIGFVDGTLGLTLIRGRLSRWVLVAQRLFDGEVASLFLVIFSAFGRGAEY